MDNLFENAANLARVQAEGYRQVREQARNEALEEAAKVCDEYAIDSEHRKQERGYWTEEAKAVQRAQFQLATAIRALMKRPA